MKKNKIEYNTIGHLSLRNVLSSLGYSDISGPLPLIKRFEGKDDVNKMKKMGVMDGGLQPGDWVVITRRRKLV